MIFNISIFIIFLLLSAFFSASETAIFSLSSLKLLRLQQKFPHVKVIRNLLNRPMHLMSVIVLGNMLVNIGISSLLTDVLVSLLGVKGLIISIISSGILIVLLGEIFPKALAIYEADKFSLFAAPILTFFSRIFLPFTFIIEKIVTVISAFVLRRFPKTTMTSIELKTALILSRKAGEITAEEEKMASYVLDFKNTWASEILTARINIEGINIKSTQEEVLKILCEVKHSKFPVYEESLDNITGILYAKDIFLNPGRDFREVLRKPILIPESKRVGDLLKTFLEKKEDIAVILDEYGGTQGIVTLEDIEEEIFGEIYDEFEIPEKYIERIDDQTWRIFGKTPVKIVNHYLGLELPDTESTLAGFLLSQLERIPRADEKLSFTAKDVRGAQKAIKVIIERATAKRIISTVLHVE